MPLSFLNALGLGSSRPLLSRLELSPTELWILIGTTWAWQLLYGIPWAYRLAFGPRRVVALILYPLLIEVAAVQLSE